MQIYLYRVLYSYSYTNSTPLTLLVMIVHIPQAEDRLCLVYESIADRAQHFVGLKMLHYAHFTNWIKQYTYT